jgi:hypothetical protein
MTLLDTPSGQFIPNTTTFIYQIAAIAMSFAALVISILAFWKASENVRLTHAKTEIDLDNKIENSRIRVIGVGLEIAKKATDKDAEIQALTHARFEAEEGYLNALDAGCQLYNDNKVDKDRFEKRYRAHIRDAVEDKAHADFLKKPGTRYHALLDVHDKFENTEKKRSLHRIRSARGVCSDPPGGGLRLTRGRRGWAATPGWPHACPSLPSLTRPTSTAALAVFQGGCPRATAGCPPGCSRGESPLRLGVSDQIEGQQPRPLEVRVLMLREHQRRWWDVVVHLSEKRQPDRLQQLGARAHPPTQDDHIGTEGERVGRKRLREVADSQGPEFVTDGQRLGGKSNHFRPSGQSRTGREPFKTRCVKRTNATNEGIAREPLHPNVTAFRVRLPAGNLAPKRHASSDARSHRDVEHIPGSHSATRIRLLNCRAVHVGVNGDALSGLECLEQRVTKREVLPEKLGRPPEDALAGVFKTDRAEHRRSHPLDRPPLQPFEAPFRDFCDSLFRALRREALRRDRLPVAAQDLDESFASTRCQDNYTRLVTLVHGPSSCAAKAVRSSARCARSMWSPPLGVREGGEAEFTDAPQDLSTRRPR